MSRPGDSITHSPLLARSRAWRTLNLYSMVNMCLPTSCLMIFVPIFLLLQLPCGKVSVIYFNYNRIHCFYSRNVDSSVARILPYYHDSFISSSLRSTVCINFMLYVRILTRDKHQWSHRGLGILVYNHATSN